jgi:hypothetical protein
MIVAPNPCRECAETECVATCPRRRTRHSRDCDRILAMLVAGVPFDGNEQGGEHRASLCIGGRTEGAAKGRQAARRAQTGTDTPRGHRGGESASCGPCVELGGIAAETGGPR